MVVEFYDQSQGARRTVNPRIIKCIKKWHKLILCDAFNVKIEFEFWPSLIIVLYRYGCRVS